ncbi:hypothetical protein LTR85_010079 [Meristemomyces frigidus]|nr:hypothetical protein LTR85_010079 [Meristemomyces frigidus]
MARLNTRPSEQPSARFDSATPQPGDSDQENRDPGARPRAKGKERAMGPPPARFSLPTPTSDPSDASRGHKRKRVEVLDPQGEAYEDEEDARFSRHVKPREGEDEEAHFNRHFNPHQDPKKRAELKRKSRALENEYLDTRDDLLRNDNGAGFTRIVTKADVIFAEIKQPNDAQSDSRLLVNVSDLAYKKTARLVLGDTSIGVDVDEFLSKCITFMRNGGPSNGEDENAPSTYRRRRTRNGNGDEDDLEGDDLDGGPLDWEVLGRRACFPYNARPPVPTFLLGPLSVEKKQRTQTQRRAKQVKDTTGREARPEALSKDDLNQSEESGLTAICTRIRQHLNNHLATGQRLLQRAGFTKDDVGSERYSAMLKKCRLADDGGIPLFEYVVNPRSFGQTVENIFYISFLIKEGAVGIGADSSTMPTLHATKARSLDDQRKAKVVRRQAVLAIDYATWQELIDVFDIRESMIQHRQEEQPTQVGERGWYA